MVTEFEENQRSYRAKEQRCRWRWRSLHALVPSGISQRYIRLYLVSLTYSFGDGDADFRQLGTSPLT